MDTSFKYDEECEIYDPYLKETVKAIATKNNDFMKILTTSSHGTWISKITAGNTFLISVSIHNKVLIYLHKYH